MDQYDGQPLVEDQDISRPGIRATYDGPVFSVRTDCRAYCSVVEVIPDVVLFLSPFDRHDMVWSPSLSLCLWQSGQSTAEV